MYIKADCADLRNAEKPPRPPYDGFEPMSYGHVSDAFEISLPSGEAPSAASAAATAECIFKCRFNVRTHLRPKAIVMDSVNGVIYVA